MKTWHIAVPAFVGGVSIPVALFMPGPAATIAVITVTACAIFAALPNFWTVPAQFLTGAAAAAGIALINTFGNIGGLRRRLRRPGALKDWTGSYVLPMFVVGGFMVLSGGADGGAEPARPGRGFGRGTTARPTGGSTAALPSGPVR